jgi:arabinogalactan endo-1,4-beta-galactosidase
MNIDDQFPSKFLKAADLNGHEIVVTIKDCIVESLGEDKRPVLYFAGKDKGVVLNKTNATNIREAYGPDTDEWTGKKVVLYTAYVDFQGRSVESIRVRKPKASEVTNASAKPEPRGAVPPQFESGDPGIDDSDIPF